MKHTKKEIEKMYNFAKELYEDEYMDIYWLKRLYNEIAEEFSLDVAFWVDWNEYWGDDEIYCYVHINNIWSIVFDWSVNRYTDENFYKDTVNYILRLEEEAEKIREKLLPINQKQKWHNENAQFVIEKI